MRCPHCKNELNLGSLRVQARWAKSSKRERVDAARKAALARWSKKRLTQKKA